MMRATAPPGCAYAASDVSMRVPMRTIANLLSRTRTLGNLAERYDRYLSPGLESTGASGLPEGSTRPSNGTIS